MLERTVPTILVCLEIVHTPQIAMFTVKLVTNHQIWTFSYVQSSHYMYTILYNSIHIIATFSWQVHAAATRVDPSVGFWSRGAQPAIGCHLGMVLITQYGHFGRGLWHLVYHIILVGGLEHVFLHILEIIIPTDELIFFRGVETTNQ